MENVCCNIRLLLWHIIGIQYFVKVICVKIKQKYVKVIFQKIRSCLSSCWTTGSIMCNFTTTSNNFYFYSCVLLDERGGSYGLPSLFSSGNSKHTRSRRQGIGRVDSPLALATACLGGRWHPPLLLPLSASISHRLRARARSTDSLLIPEVRRKLLRKSTSI